MKTLHSVPGDRELLRLLSGQLPAEEAERLEQRLASDPALRAAYSRLSGSWQKLELPPPTPAPTGYAARLTVRATTAIALAPLARRRRWLVMALLLSLGMNLGLVLSALFAPPKTRPAKPPASLASEAGVERAADELGLEGLDRRHFVERHRLFHEEAQGPRERVRQLRLELTRELFARPTNQARIDQLVAALGAEWLRFENVAARLVLDVQRQLPEGQHETYRRFLDRLKADGPGESPPGR